MEPNTSIYPWSVIGAPSSAGAYGPGQERAPEAFRRHGLITHLRNKGLQVVDRGDTAKISWHDDTENPRAKNVVAVARVATEVAGLVAAALQENHQVLVLGGDCTIELGTVAGAIRDGASVGLAYIDLDADLNTPNTGDGVLDWMGVAHLLDALGTHPLLTSLGVTRPMLQPSAVRLFGTDNITPSEQQLIDHYGLHVEGLSNVQTDMPWVAQRTHAWANQFDRLLVHVDADVLDYAQFPIAENTDLRSGLSLHELGTLLQMLTVLPNFQCLTMTEINPDHAKNETNTFLQLINAIGSTLHKRPTQAGRMRMANSAAPIVVAT